MMHDMGDWGWWPAVMWTGMIVAWIVLIGTIWAIFAALQRSGGGASAEDVLARRLAHGDITREEYQATLDALRGEPRRSTEAHDGAR